MNLFKTRIPKRRKFQIYCNGFKPVQPKGLNLIKTKFPKHRAIHKTIPINMIGIDHEGWHYLKPTLQNNEWCTQAFGLKPIWANKMAGIYKTLFPQHRIMPTNFPIGTIRRHYEIRNYLKRGFQNIVQCTNIPVKTNEVHQENRNYIKPIFQNIE